MAAREACREDLRRMRQKLRPCPVHGPLEDRTEQLSAYDRDEHESRGESLFRYQQIANHGEDHEGEDNHATKAREVTHCLEQPVGTD